MSERGQSTEILYYAQWEAAIERASFSWHLPQYVIAIARICPSLFCAAEHVLGRGTSETVQIASVNYQQQKRTEAAVCRSNNSPFCSLPNSWPVCFKIKLRKLLFVAVMVALRSEPMVEFSCLQTALKLWHLEESCFPAFSPGWWWKLTIHSIISYANTS